MGCSTDASRFKADALKLDHRLVWDGPSRRIDRMDEGEEDRNPWWEFPPRVVTHSVVPTTGSMWRFGEETGARHQQARRHPSPAGLQLERSSLATEETPGAGTLPVHRRWRVNIQTRSRGGRFGIGKIPLEKPRRIPKPDPIDLIVASLGSPDPCN